MSTNKARFSIIGCGRVGVSLSVFLGSRGYEPAGFFSRSQESARFAREMTGKGEVFEDAVGAARAGEIVFLTTPDTQIESVCKALADAGGITAGKLVFHLSGALSSDILCSARDQGAETGSIHPLQAFAPYARGQANPFAGIHISVEGSPVAQARGEKIAAALGARPFAIPTQAKTLYHASAVVASNYLVTLEHFALALLMETGLKEREAYEILEPLIQGTLANIRERGCAKALTGPIARGDAQIVARHLADIDDRKSEFSALYRLLGQETLKIARAGMNQEAAQNLSRLLES